jgi:NADH:ubiquinone oxidoreductase subunit K
MIPLIHLLYLAAFLFVIGLMIVITKRNAIMVLIGLELMLNASNINLVAFNQLHPDNINGQMFALFIIIVAVCETAVGLAIVLHVYKLHHTSIPDETSELKG